MVTKLGIYVRQSREKKDSVSIPDQIEKGKAKALELNLAYEVYVDEGETAITDTLDKRPAMLKLLKDVQHGSINAGFAFDESRISRNENTKLLIKRTLKNNNVILYTQIDGIIDFNDLNSEFVSGLRTLINQKMVRETSMKIKSALEYNAKIGKAGGGGLLPFGFTKDSAKKLIHYPEEIEIYLRMVDMSLKGIGTSTIADTFNKEGIKTKASKNFKNGIKIKNKYTGTVTHIQQEEIDWAPNTILTILKNPIYKGERRYKGNSYPIEPVISAEHWDHLQTNLSKNKNFSVVMVIRVMRH